MSKNRIVLTIGSILLLMPFLGFPSGWESCFSILCGLILIGLSLSISIQKRATVREVQKSKVDDLSTSFVDGYGASPSSDDQSPASISEGDNQDSL